MLGTMDIAIDVDRRNRLELSPRHWSSHLGIDPESVLSRHNQHWTEIAKLLLWTSSGGRPYDHRGTAKHRLQFRIACHCINVPYFILLISVPLLQTQSFVYVLHFVFPHSINWAKMSYREISYIYENVRRVKGGRMELAGTYLAVNVNDSLLAYDCMHVLVKCSCQ